RVGCQKSNANFDDLVRIVSHVNGRSDFFETNIYTGKFYQEHQDASFFHVNHINIDDMLLLEFEDMSFALPMVEDFEITLPLPDYPLELETDGLSMPPTSANSDHDLYLNLFFSIFCVQVPLFHVPTWIMADKPIFLVRAMQAAGALFAQTEAAYTFIDEVLSSSQDSISLELEKLSDEPRDQNRFLLTVILLQTISLYHLKAERAMSSNMYHEILVTMIRRQDIIARVNSWMINLSEVTMDNLDSTWREWARCETIKRAIFLTFLHDCSLCMYFGFKPSFHPSELDLCLPCDDSLWKAPNSTEWYIACQFQSNHDGRKFGFPMQRALSNLGETHLPRRMAVSFNPFSHHILIHTILRNLFAPYSVTCAGPSNLTAPVTEFAMLSLSQQDNPLAIQLALNNWLQGWLEIQESTFEEANTASPFAQDALSFYWLAQMSLLGLQHGSLADFRLVMTTDVKEAVEGRIRTLKSWLDRIRSLLKTGNGASMPASLWEELTIMQTKDFKIDLKYFSGDLDMPDF
ncbi:hypothetical protein H0H93_011568, partial [Arthromyces matolae]